MFWIILVLLFILIIGGLVNLLIIFKSHVSTMVGMCTAMAGGMMIGLTSGTLLGILFNDAFFQVTVISMFIGALFGVVFGYPFSFVGIIDGFLSGLMGGMMGAMLAVMVPFENHLPLIQVMLLLLFGTLFILHLALTYDLKNMKRRTFLIKPTWCFLLVCASFICIYFLEVPDKEPLHSPPTHHHAIKKADYIV